MRKLLCLVGLSLLVSLPAVAQEARSTTDISLGYSYIRANPSTTGFSSFNVNGSTASLAYTRVAGSESQGNSATITSGRLAALAWTQT